MKFLLAITGFEDEESGACGKKQAATTNWGKHFVYSL